MEFSGCLCLHVDSEIFCLVRVDLNVDPKYFVLFESGYIKMEFFFMDSSRVSCQLKINFAGTFRDACRQKMFCHVRIGLWFHKSLCLIRVTLHVEVNYFITFGSSYGSMNVFYYFYFLVAFTSNRIGSFRSCFVLTEIILPCSDLELFLVGFGLDFGMTNRIMGFDYSCVLTEIILSCYDWAEVR